MHLNGNRLAVCSSLCYRLSYVRFICAERIQVRRLRTPLHILRDWHSFHHTTPSACDRDAAAVERNLRQRITNSRKTTEKKCKLPNRQNNFIDFRFWFVELILERCGCRWLLHNSLVLCSVHTERQSRATQTHRFAYYANKFHFTR